jgi:glucose/arabinose dehydrogenase
VEVPVTLSGGTVTAGSLQVLATGVRNSSNPIVAPNGDIYIGDNGYDANGAPVNPDTLDRIPAGASAPWFGLPGNYIAYGSGQVVGGGFTPPFVAFQPENGVDSFGISGLAFAPSDFPAQYQGGMFASFGGNYDYPGTANVTDPLVFISSTGAYTHFIESGQDGWGTVGDLLATGGALYAPVMFTGTDSPWQENTGVIYAILPAPEPDTWLACAVFGCLLPIARRRRGH